MKVNYPYVLFLAATASLGGLLLGCDTAVVSGTIGFLKTHFHLSVQLTGWAASSVLVGCICGAGIAGFLGDRYGRKWILFGCAILFAGSSILSACAHSIAVFTVARFMGGIAIGAASILSPLYIAEIAPKQIRGMLVAFYQLAIVVAICGVFFINLYIQRVGNETWNITSGWRWMFISLIIPAGLFAGLLLTISESPRWLMKVGRREEARVILEKLGGRAHASFELQQIKEALQHEEGRWSELFTTGYFRALMLGTLLAVFGQLSGINAIMYYAPEIFKIAGQTTDTAFILTTTIGLTNLLFTFAAIWFVDRLGRKPLLLLGTLLQAVALFFVGLFFHKNPTMLLIPILAFVAAFAVAIGPITWIVNSEIFPTKLRGRFMSLAILVHWVGDFLVTQTFPILTQIFGATHTFWIYSFLSFLSFLFVWGMLPETKGRTLEEIEQSWIANK